MTEPVRSARDIEVVLYSRAAPDVGTTPVPWVGYADVYPDKIRPVLFISYQEFDRIWAMAFAGLLKHGLMVLTKPHYRNAYVISLSPSTHPEE